MTGVSVFVQGSKDLEQLIEFAKGLPTSAPTVLKRIASMFSTSLGESFEIGKALVSSEVSVHHDSMVYGGVHQK
jgi:hypothetical protein